MPAGRVLITGISGFIAKHCAIELLKAGYRVRGTVRTPAAHKAVRATLAEHADVTALGFVEADLLADTNWTDAVEGCDGVLHVASPFRAASQRTRTC
jgi:nucleoside-diphosphate-sugar epimerase